MVDPRKLETAILRAIGMISVDGLVEFYMGELRNRIVRQDESLVGLSNQETVDAVRALAKSGSLEVRKRISNSNMTLDPEVSSDWEIQMSQGPFEMKLTHEGRKAMTHIEVNVTDNIRDPDEFDDRLPLLHRSRIFDLDLKKFAEDALKNGSPLSLIMVDLDDFKAVNDTHGHPAGNEVLLGVSKIIAERVKNKGRAYRYGGDEISVLLPNYTVYEGTVLAEVIRTQIEGTALGDANIKITVSIGLAVMPDHAQDSAKLLDLSDKAAYAAKKLGRNLVRVHGEPERTQPKLDSKRKQPVPGGLSESEREKIRITYFRHSAAECPRDGANLRIRELADMGRRTPNIMAICPVCGLRELIEGPN